MKPSRALLIVSAAVFLSTSTWFTGTAATPVLAGLWSLTDVQCAWLTIAVQLGFIIGTLLYAVFNIADIFSASRVFFFSACLGAVFNAGFGLVSMNLGQALVFRVLTGVTLAGIYPVGMKIVASWYRSGLGWRLGIMVGALTLGTAFPYFIHFLGTQFDWRLLVLTASFLTVAGGCLVFLGKTDGPYLRAGTPFKASMALRIFRHKAFRLQSFGYFGHMWELYAFWSLSGLFLSRSISRNNPAALEYLPLISFLVIGIGTLGCVIGGRISRSLGERRVALISLFISGVFCLSSWFIYTLPVFPQVFLVLIWGFFVIADSPQFSALAAKTCPPAYTGTALTMQNGIGFAVTVISIHTISLIARQTGWQWAFLFLLPGPLIGVYSTWKLRLDIKSGTGNR
jgi:MFS family permease